MTKENHSKLIIAYFVAFILSSSLMTTGCKDKKEDSVKRPQISGVKIEPVAVSTVDDIYEVTGTVRSTFTSIVASRVMGTITSLPVREGDFVKQGQLLLTIDDRDTAQRLQAANMSVEAAKQNQSLAEKTWQRYKKLHAEDVVSQQEMDRIDTQKKLADAEYNRVKAMADEAATHMSFTKVTAPLAGRITEKRIEAGSMATPGMPLLVVEGGGNSYIEVSIDAGVGPAVKTGMPVEAEVDTMTGSLAGFVKEVFPAVDPASRTFTAKIGFKNANPRSGLFARVRIPIGKKEAIIVSEQAVVRKGQLTGVYAVDDQGLVTYRLVRTGKSSAAGTEILSGLKARDRIVTSGIEKVIDGGMISGEKMK
ncbi:MAG: efflux RND transporter periplasmic adaptor subunit [Smithella sp.]